MINLMGPWNKTGYGVHTRNMLRALAKLTRVCYFPYPEYTMKMFGFDSKTEEEIFINTHYVGKKTLRDVPCVKIWHETGMQAFVSSPRVAFPVWEADKIAPLHVDTLNSCDLILVPSEWQKRSFIASGGAKDKVAVVPEGVDTTIFNPRNGYTIKDADAPLKFSHIGKAENRKATKQIVEAFTDVFGNDKNVQLVMYISNPFVSEFELRREYGTSKAQNVTYVWTPIDDPKYVAQMINSSDVMVFAPKAEGWGLPILESLACGKITISTCVTGHSQYVTKSNCIVVETKGMEPMKDPFFPFPAGAQWHKLDMDSLRSALQEAQTRALHARANHLEVANLDGVSTALRYTWTNAAKTLLQTLADFKMIDLSLPFANLTLP